MKVKKWILAKSFSGVPTEENLQLVEEDLADELKPNEVLLQAVYLSVDPYMRVFTSNLKEGSEMIGEQLSEVIKTKNGQYPLGTLVLSNAGWVSHYKSTGHGLEPIRFDLGGTPISYCLGTLGMPGAAAYIGLYNLCQPVAGQTVLVNAAAGAVGSLVGQLAKLRGCKVIAFVGTDEKVKWCKEDLNFDHVFNYKKTSINEALNQVAPDGIDVFFDNVGGEFYHAVIVKHMKNHGKVCVCGEIETYNDTEEKHFDDTDKAIKSKQLSIKILNVYSHKNLWPQIFSELNTLIKQSKIKVRETRYQGIEKMRDAFYGLFKSENTGKAIIRAINERSNYRDY